MPAFELQVTIIPPLTGGETVVLDPPAVQLMPGGTRRVAVQIQSTAGVRRNATAVTNVFTTGATGLNVWTKASPKTPQSVPAAHELDIEAGGGITVGAVITVKGQAA